MSSEIVSSPAPTKEKVSSLTDVLSDSDDASSASEIVSTLPAEEESVEGLAASHENTDIDEAKDVVSPKLYPRGAAWTPADLENLLNLRKTIGENWGEIGRRLGRSVHASRVKYYTHTAKLRQRNASGIDGNGDESSAFGDSGGHENHDESSLLSADTTTDGTLWGRDLDSKLMNAVRIHGQDWEAVGAAIGVTAAAASERYNRSNRRVSRPPQTRIPDVPKVRVYQLWSPEDVAKIVLLHELIGDDWDRIGLTVKRSALAARAKFINLDAAQRQEGLDYAAREGLTAERILAEIDLSLKNDFTDDSTSPSVLPSSRKHSRSISDEDQRHVRGYIPAGSVFPNPRTPYDYTSNMLSNGNTVNLVSGQENGTPSYPAGPFIPPSDVPAYYPPYVMQPPGDSSLDNASPSRRKPLSANGSYNLVGSQAPTSLHGASWGLPPQNVHPSAPGMMGMMHIPNSDPYGRQMWGTDMASAQRYPEHSLSQSVPPPYAVPYAHYHLPGAFPGHVPMCGTPGISVPMNMGMNMNGFPSVPHVPLGLGVSMNIPMNMGMPMNVSMNMGMGMGMNMPPHSFNSGDMTGSSPAGLHDSVNTASVAPVSSTSAATTSAPVVSTVPQVIPVATKSQSRTAPLSTSDCYTASPDYSRSPSSDHSTPLSLAKVDAY